MPRLKTIRFGYYTKRAKDLTMFDVPVSVSQDGTFYCAADTMPEAIRRAFASEFENTEKLKSETLSGLTRKINEYIERHRQLLLEEGRTKVIMYRILLQGDLTPDLGGNEDGSRRHNDFDRECDIGLGLEWDVVWRSKILGSTEYTYTNGTSFRWTYKRKEIPWTEAREQWFQELENSIRSLLLRVDGFFKKMEPTALMQFIDSGRALLPAPNGSDGHDE